MSDTSLIRLVQRNPDLEFLWIAWVKDIMSTANQGINVGSLELLGRLGRLAPKLTRLHIPWTILPGIPVASIRELKTECKNLQVVTFDAIPYAVASEEDLERLPVQLQGLAPCTMQKRMELMEELSVTVADLLVAPGQDAGCFDYDLKQGEAKLPWMASNVLVPEVAKTWVMNMGFVYDKDLDLLQTFCKAWNNAKIEWISDSLATVRLTSDHVLVLIHHPAGKGSSSFDAYLTNVKDESKIVMEWAPRPVVFVFRDFDDFLPRRIASTIGWESWTAVPTRTYVADHTFTFLASNETIETLVQPFSLQLLYVAVRLLTNLSPAATVHWITSGGRFIQRARALNDFVHAGRRLV